MIGFGAFVFFLMIAAMWFGRRVAAVVLAILFGATAGGPIVQVITSLGGAGKAFVLAVANLVTDGG